MSGEAFPGPPFVAARPHFATGGAEIDAYRVAGVGAHRLALDREPRLTCGKAPRLALPALAAVHGAIHRRLASRRDTRPHLRAVHREYPDRVGIARVQDHRKPD